MALFALSYSASQIVDGERVGVYQLVPISPEQAQPDYFTSPTIRQDPPGKPVMLTWHSGLHSQPFMPLGNGFYRDLSKQEKRNTDG